MIPAPASAVSDSHSLIEAAVSITPLLQNLIEDISDLRGAKIQVLGRKVTSNNRTRD